MVPAPETSLLWAAKLAAVNPTQQNPKLISQALNVMPLALKLFQPKDAAALMEEEQQVIVDQGSIVVQPSQTDLGSHGQVIGVANCFLNIWLATGKIDLGEKSEYLDHLHRMHCSFVADLQLFHDGLVSDLQRDDTFDIVSRKTTYFVNGSLILLMAMPLEE